MSMADEEAAIGVRRPLLAPHNGDDEARHAADAGDDATPARTSTADNYAPGAALPAEGSEADEISGNTACASSSGCSLLSVTATLTIGVLGTGQLALPFALSRVGLYLGVGCLAVMGSFAVATLYMLAACKAAVGARDYGNLLRAFLGPAAAHGANLLLALYAWGGGVTYLMILGQEAATVADHVLGGGDFSLSARTYLGAAVALIILPLSCVRQLDRLKFTSTFGAAAAVYITLVVAANALTGVWGAEERGPCLGPSDPECTDGGSCNSALAGASAPGPALHMFPSLLPLAGANSSGDTVYFSLGPNFDGLPMFHVLFNITTALAICGFALNSAWCFVPLVHALRDSTRARASALIVASQAIILVNYALISVTGYFSYCSETKDDILQNLPNTPAVLAARAMLVAQLICGLPLRFSVTRGIVNKYVFGEAPRGGARHPERCLWLHCLSTLAVVGSAAGTAMAASSIALVMSLASTVCAAAISYVFPAACYLLLLARSHGKHVPWGAGAMARAAVSALILAFGLLMMVGGTAINIVGASKGYVVIGG